MKHQLSGDLKGLEIARRALFSCAFTAVVALFVYFSFRGFGGVYD